VRQRAEAAKTLIDSGGGAGVAAIVKAAQALPPAPIAPAGAPAGAADQAQDQQAPQQPQSQAAGGGAAQ
jgi:hypothetical protein